jgi:hypothetical protein
MRPPHFGGGATAAVVATGAVLVGKHKRRGCLQVLLMYQFGTSAYFSIMGVLLFNQAITPCICIIRMHTTVQESHKSQSKQ